MKRIIISFNLSFFLYPQLIDNYKILINALVGVLFSFECNDSCQCMKYDNHSHNK